MQEEVTDKAIMLSIKAFELSEEILVAALKKAAKLIGAGGVKALDAVAMPEGKQSVRRLVRSGEALSSMELSKANLKGFERVVRKYGVKYSITRDTASNPPRYNFFFRSKNADVLTAAFKEYGAQVLKKQTQKQSVRARLQKAKEAVRDTAPKVRDRVMER